MNMVEKSMVTENHVFTLPWYICILILIVAIGIIVWIIRKNKKNK